MSNSHLHALPASSRVEKCEIVRVLGMGGFGITYLAFDHRLDRPVALKEYFPAEFAARTHGRHVTVGSTEYREVFAWGFDRFIDEARALRRFRHRNVVQAHRYIQAHGTAYIAMEYVEGDSLAAILETRESLPVAEWRRWMDRLLDGLAHVHDQGYLHRDIKPGNIVLRATNNEPVLIDFGAARVATQERTHTRVFTPEYAPIEQHASQGAQGPPTDIYSLAAVSYRALTGEPPPTSPDRVLDDRYKPLTERIRGSDRAWLAAIDQGLAVRPEDRPQTVATWCTMLHKAEIAYGQTPLATPAEHESVRLEGDPASQDSWHTLLSGLHWLQSDRTFWSVMTAAAVFVLVMVTLTWQEQRIARVIEDAPIAPGFDRAAQQQQVTPAGSILPIAEEQVQQQPDRSTTDYPLVVHDPGRPEQPPTDYLDDIGLSLIPSDTGDDGAGLLAPGSDLTEWRGNIEMIGGDTEVIETLAGDDPNASAGRRVQANSQYFTRGSHQDDVLRIQGTPDAINRYEALGEEVWRYGGSRISISTRSQQVLEWSNTGGNLRVHLEPGSTTTSTDYFTRGSHQDDVLRIQGTPDAINRYEALGEEVWRYGGSRISISTRSQQVLEWSNTGGNLRVHLEPGSTTTSTDYFTRGSHQDDVLRIQGTPDAINRYEALGEEVWRYGGSRISISTRSQQVLEWSNTGGNLRVHLEPGSTTTSTDYFTRGSHQDDVLRIQGTPDAINRYEALGEEVWRYGGSRISISTRSQQVLEWSNAGGNLRVQLNSGTER